MSNIRRRSLGILAIAISFCFLLGGFVCLPALASSETEENEIKLLDFRGNGRVEFPAGTGADASFSSLPGATEEEIALAKSYVQGGTDQPNEYSFRYAGDIEVPDAETGETTTVSGCEIISYGATGDIWVAQGKLADNDKANPDMPWEDKSNYPAFKDYESFNIQLYVENPQGIEYILVRLFDEEEQGAVAEAQILVSADYGFQYSFRNATLTEGWTYVELDLEDIPLYDTRYRQDYGDHVRGDAFLESIEGGIKGNRPVPVGEDSGPLRCSYVQVVVLFNQLATAENPTRVVFDEMNLSKQSVAPTLEKVSEEALTAETGQTVSLKEAFTVTDNRTSAEDMNYTLTVSKDGTAIGTDAIDTANLSFIPYKAGTYEARVTAVDADGNEGSISLEVTVTGEDIDVDAPTVDSAALNDFLAQSPFTDFSPIDLKSITFTDDYSAAADLMITYTVVHSDGTAFTVTDGVFTPDRNGRYTITIVAADEAGNDVTVTRNITVNNPDAVEPPESSDDDGGSGGCGCGGSVSGAGSLLALLLIPVGAAIRKAKRG